MRIVYKDIGDEFAKLLQEAINNRDKISMIQVTRAEMNALLKHQKASMFFGEYIERRNIKEQQLRNQIDVTLKQALERAVTSDEKQVIYDRISDAEMALHKLMNDPIGEITNNGITIRVTMQA